MKGLHCNTVHFRERLLNVISLRTALESENHIKGQCVALITDNFYNQKIHILMAFNGFLLQFYQEPALLKI